MRRIGKIISYNEELISHPVVTESRKVIHSKNLKNLNDKKDDFSIEDDIENMKEVSNSIKIVKKTDPEEILNKVKEKEITDPESEESDLEDKDQVSSSLIEQKQILRDRTVKVKPVKYSYLTGDPKCLLMAKTSKDERNGLQKPMKNFPTLKAMKYGTICMTDLLPFFEKVGFSRQASYFVTH